MSGAHTALAQVSARNRRVVVVAARFNDRIVSQLIAGASTAWRARGGADDDLKVVRVPGAFELPLVAQTVAASGQYHAVVALGCVIRGDTPHFEYIARECARGLQNAALKTGVPVAFGVLTVENERQALERAAPGPGNKGAEALESMLEMIEVLAGA